MIHKTESFKGWKGKPVKKNKKNLGPKTGNTIKDGAFCVICNGKITSENYQIIGYENSEPVTRHNACCPGSARWMASAIGQESLYRKYFEVKE